MPTVAQVNLISCKRRAVHSHFTPSGFDCPPFVERNLMLQEGAATGELFQWLAVGGVERCMQFRLANEISKLWRDDQLFLAASILVEQIPHFASHARRPLCNESCSIATDRTLADQGLQ